MITAAHEKPSFFSSILRRDIRGGVVDFDSVFGPYVGTQLFLAVTRDLNEVVASDATPLGALEKARKTGYNKVSIMKAPKERYTNLIL